ncbi:hypothetical protein CBR_g12937 [Chara braunii]|uniref:Uncharacterized protein n=1 Tax=Chara braunii TaxID=69332 RepID=A0A388KT34_CHABU|nr:hypothetical protein CBR_g12937 [Chara braunii]|eukprot:GBG73220.1 hypothetical protein CBR_g12937 [Chara braunii]
MAKAIDSLVTPQTHPDPTILCTLDVSEALEDLQGEWSARDPRESWVALSRGPRGEHFVVEVDVGGRKCGAFVDIASTRNFISRDCVDRLCLKDWVQRLSRPVASSLANKERMMVEDYVKDVVCTFSYPGGEINDKISFMGSRAGALALLLLQRPKARSPMYRPCFVWGLPAVAPTKVMKMAATIASDIMDEDILVYTCVGDNLAMKEKVFVDLWGAESHFHAGLIQKDPAVPADLSGSDSEEGDLFLTEEEKLFHAKLLASGKERGRIIAANQKMEVNRFARNAFLPTVPPRWVESQSRGVDDKLWDLLTFNYVAPIHANSYRFLASFFELELQKCNEKALTENTDICRGDYPLTAENMKLPVYLFLEAPSLKARARAFRVMAKTTWRAPILASVVFFHMREIMVRMAHSVALNPSKTPQNILDDPAIMLNKFPRTMAKLILPSMYVRSSEKRRKEASSSKSATKKANKGQQTTLQFYVAPAQEHASVQIISTPPTSTVTGQEDGQASASNRMIRKSPREKTSAKTILFGAGLSFLNAEICVTSDILGTFSTGIRECGETMEEMATDCLGWMTFKAEIWAKYEDLRRDEIEDDIIFDETNLEDFKESIDLYAEKRQWEEEEKLEHMMKKVAPRECKNGARTNVSTSEFPKCVSFGLEVTCVDKNLVANFEGMVDARAVSASGHASLGVSNALASLANERIHLLYPVIEGRAFGVGMDLRWTKKVWAHFTTAFEGRDLQKDSNFMLSFDNSVVPERGSVGIEELFPKLGEKAGVTITDDILGEAVVSGDMVEEENGNVFGVMRGGAWDEVSTFGFDVGKEGRPMEITGDGIKGFLETKVASGLGIVVLGQELGAQATGVRDVESAGAFGFNVEKVVVEDGVEVTEFVVDGGEVGAREVSLGVAMVERWQELDVGHGGVDFLRGLVVGAAGKGVGNTVAFAEGVANGEGKLGKEVEPTGLARGDVFLGKNRGNDSVIGADGEVLPVEVRASDFEGIDHGEELLLVGWVVHFCGKEFLAGECDGVLAGWALGVSGGVLDGGGFRGVGGKADLFGVHADAVGGDNVTKVFYARDSKCAFAELGVEFLVEEDGENLAVMIKVGLEGGAKNKDVVEVDHDTDFEEVAEDVVHGGLECSGGVGETERHYEKLVVPEAGAEGGLVGVLLADADLVEATAEINLGEVFGFTEAIKKFGYPGKRILVLDRDLVQGAVVCAHAEFRGAVLLDE